MLPAMTLRDMDPAAGKGRPEDSDIDKLGYPALDYEEALNFGQSKYAKLIQHLERHCLHIGGLTFERFIAVVSTFRLD